MTNEQLIDTVKQLVAIESTLETPDGLQQVHDFMIDYVLKHNKDVTIERFVSGGKPSFLAYRGGQRPEKFHVVLNGHLDTVPGRPEQYQAELKDGKLYGRGVYDMKAACIVMAQVFCEFVDKVPFALGLQLVTDEESAGLHGTRYQVEQGVRADFVICGECGRSTKVHEIANAAKGIALLDINFTGASAHGAYPWNGENAALRAHHFVDAIHKLYPSPKEATEKSTVTVTGILAHSDAHNQVPDRATVKLDIRFAPYDPHLSSKEKFLELVHEIDPTATITDPHGYGFSSPLYTDPNDPLLGALKASAEAIEGAPFKLALRHATSDGRHYGDVGNQACEFGIAGEHQHGDGEYITLEAFANFRATLEMFLERISKPATVGRAVAIEQRATATV